MVRSARILFALAVLAFGAIPASVSAAPVVVFSCDGLDAYASAMQEAMPPMDGLALIAEGPGSADIRLTRVDEDVYVNWPFDFRLWADNLEAFTLADIPPALQSYHVNVIQIMRLRAASVEAQMAEDNEAARVIYAQISPIATDILSFVGRKSDACGGADALHAALGANPTYPGYFTGEEVATPIVI